MSTVTGPQTMADLLERLGGISPQRVRWTPVPGTAIARDVHRIHLKEGRLYELVDGVLVEKAIGFLESYLAVALASYLNGFLEDHDLGVVLGADGMMRFARGLVRIPDVAFISWTRLPGRRIPTEPIPALAPDLAVEVLSKGNTRREMTRKLHDYFEAGVALVWYIEPQKKPCKYSPRPRQ